MELAFQYATIKVSVGFGETVKNARYKLRGLKMKAKQFLMPIALYTVYRCKSKTSNDRIGPFHGSDYGEKTLCGKPIDEGWFIADNTFTGKITCKKCLDELAIRTKKF